MTWVVGATTPFGYGIMVSDVCVTIKDGGQSNQRDILRKVYPVGRMLAGFAGSVQIGFDMIAGLRDFLKMTEVEAKENMCWEPQWVAENFGPQARTIFSGHSEGIRKGRCEVMLMGIHPEEHIWGRGRPVAAVLRAPEFIPEVATGWGQVLSIGSGSGQRAAMDALAATVSNVDLMHAEVGYTGGFGRTIASSMTRDLFGGAPPGVSRHMHVSHVFIDRFGFAPNDMEYHPREGAPEVLRMPTVAESWVELCKLLVIDPCQGVGITAEGVYGSSDQG